MFQSATSFNKPIENWNTRQVTSMSYMFHYATSFNHYVGGWDTSSLSSYDYIFRYATAFQAKYTCTDANYYNSVRPSTCSTLRSSWIAPPSTTIILMRQKKFFFVRLYLFDNITLPTSASTTVLKTPKVRQLSFLYPHNI